MAMQEIRATTVLAVRRDGIIAVGGDGQVTMGDTVMKATAQKVRTLRDGRILAGFAGAVADAFSLFEKLEEKLERYPGNLTRACVELAKDWRTDRYLRRLNASATAPAKPARILPSFNVRTFWAVAFITVSPNVTCPSPPRATFPPFRTARTVVARNSGFLMTTPRMGY